MIIVVSGLPGTGKSYFAEKLSGRLGAVHFNSDKMRNALHARGKYTIDDKLHIYRVMAEEADQVLGHPHAPGDAVHDEAESADGHVLSLGRARCPTARAR